MEDDLIAASWDPKPTAGSRQKIYFPLIKR
jgi:hypothetical protein